MTPTDVAELVRTLRELGVRRYANTADGVEIELEAAPVLVPAPLAVERALTGETDEQRRAREYEELLTWSST